MSDLFKDWRNFPDTSTPLSAEAIEELQQATRDADAAQVDAREVYQTVATTITLTADFVKRTILTLSPTKTQIYIPLSIPGLPVGEVRFPLRQMGIGAVKIVWDPGVTVAAPDGTLVKGQFRGGTIVRVFTNYYVLEGDFIIDPGGNNGDPTPPPPPPPPPASIVTDVDNPTNPTGITVLSVPTGTVKVHAAEMDNIANPSVTKYTYPGSDIGDDVPVATATAPGYKYVPHAGTPVADLLALDANGDGIGEWGGRRATNVSNTPPPPPPPPPGFMQGIVSYNNHFAGLPAHTVEKIVNLGATHVRVANAEGWCSLQNWNAWAGVGLILWPNFCTPDLVAQLPDLTDGEFGNEPYFGDSGGLSPGDFADAFIEDFAKPAKAERPGFRCWMPIDVGVDVIWTDHVSTSPIDEMFQARPDLGQWIDGYCHHPYTIIDPSLPDTFWGNDGAGGKSVAQRLDLAQQAFLNHNVHIPGAITEWGYSTQEHGGDVPRSFINSMQTIVQARSYIKGIYFYQIADQITGGGQQETFGLYEFHGDYGVGIGPAKNAALGVADWFGGTA